MRSDARGEAGGLGYAAAAEVGEGAAAVCLPESKLDKAGERAELKNAGRKPAARPLTAGESLFWFCAATFAICCCICCCWRVC